MISFQKILRIIESYNIKYNIHGITFDNINGAGSIPNNVDVYYKGFIVFMTPKDFIKLNPSRDWDHKHIKNIVSTGQPIGTPSIQTEIIENNGNIRLKVISHEGRGRMLSLIEIGKGDLEFPVGVFLYERGIGSISMEKAYRKFGDKIMKSPIISDDDAKEHYVFIPKRIDHRMSDGDAHKPIRANEEHQNNPIDRAKEILKNRDFGAPPFSESTMERKRMIIAKVAREIADDNQSLYREIYSELMRFINRKPLPFKNKKPANLSMLFGRKEADE